MSPRVYVRRFDYDEAQRRYDAGESIAALAAEYGVSTTAVYRAINPVYRARADACAAEYQRSGMCPDCGEQTTRRAHGRSARCAACYARSRVTTVREAELRCSTCREWKPDHAFPHSRAEPARRGRHLQCTSCQTAARRDYRERHREAQRAYDRAYRRRRRLAQMTPLQRATSRLTEEAA